MTTREDSASRTHEREALAEIEFAICVATFYEDLAERLVNGAVEAFGEQGVSAASVHTYEVPGAFELPLAAKLSAESGRFAGVACLGVVIRGETNHYDYVCAEAARGIQQVQLDTGVPCAFGVITCETREQAEARAGGGKRDQGRNAAIAVMRMASSGRRWTELQSLYPATIPRPMAKVCHSCGKRPAFGNSRSHSMVATRRRFNPNLQKVRIQEAARAPVASTSAPLPQVQQGHESSISFAPAAGSATQSPALADPSIERFRRVVSAASAYLEERRQEVNDLNVFPVADGDTGDNMALTLRAVSDELDRLDGQMVDEVGRDRARQRARPGGADGRARQLRCDPQPDRPRRRRGAGQPSRRADRPGRWSRRRWPAPPTPPTSRSASRPRGRC